MAKVLTHSVTVALRFLVPSVKVRILVGQQEYRLKSIINAIYNGFLVFGDSDFVDASQYQNFRLKANL